MVSLKNLKATRCQKCWPSPGIIKKNFNKWENLFFCQWAPGKSGYNAWSYKCADVILFNLAVGLTSLQRIKPRVYFLFLCFSLSEKTEFLQEVFWGEADCFLLFCFGRISFLDLLFHLLIGWPSSRVCHWRNGSTLCFKSMFASTSESDEVQNYGSGKIYTSYARVILPYLQKYILTSANILYDKPFVCKLFMKITWFSLDWSICIKGKNHGCCCRLKKVPKAPFNTKWSLIPAS